MNKDTIKGKIKEAAGDVQEHLGRLVGSRKQEAKGHALEAEGKIQKAYGQTTKALDDATQNVSDALRKKSH